MMETQYHSIVGLPRSGKTTFLAALWHLIDAGEVSTKLVLDRLVGNNTYLNAIVEAWRRCEEVPRTSMAAEESVSIHVHEPATGRKAVLGFPDLSGESFEAQFAARACKPEYVSGYDGEGGIMLFINADRGSDGMTVLDIGPDIGGDDGAQQPQMEDWSAKCVPEQVRLVDLLQFLLVPPFRRRCRRLAVVASAWDVIPEPKIGPADWLAREMPLLDQFLKNNPGSFEVRAYGVSAQGGKVTGDERAGLLKLTPSQRIQCVGPGAVGHDLTAPLVWLSGGD
jgi:hypothetical protein